MRPYNKICGIRGECHYFTASKVYIGKYFFNYFKLVLHFLD